MNHNSEAKQARWGVCVCGGGRLTKIQSAEINVRKEREVRGTVRQKQREGGKVQIH